MADVQWMPLMQTGLAIRMEALNEVQAMKNHGQTLARLAERGGIRVCEAAAIIERRAWRPMTEGAALHVLRRTPPHCPPTPYADVPQHLLTALRFYARGEHYHLEPDKFDTVSDEPPNWLCHEDEPTMVEDGSIARQALLGMPTDWRDGDDDHTPQPIAGEAALKPSGDPV